MKKFIPITFLFLFSIAANVFAEYNYEAINYAANRDTWLFGVNDSGAVVGNESVYGMFIYSNGNFQSIRPPSIFTPTAGCAYDINNNGQVVGYYTENTDGTFKNFGFYYDGTTYTKIDYMNLGDTVLTGINDNGYIIGRSGTGDSRSFIYHNGTFQEIFIPGATSVTVCGINNSNTIVGVYNDASGRHSFSYSNGVVTIITSPTLNIYSAEGINDSGIIVGWADFAGKYYGYTYDGFSFDLIYCTIANQNGSSTRVNGINNLGQLVGIYDNPNTSPMPWDAFVATPANKILGISFDKPEHIVKERNHTESFNTMTKMVIRRGFDFDIRLKLPQNFVQNSHDLKIEAYHNFDNIVTTISIPVGFEDIQQGEWGAQQLDFMEDSNGDKIAIVKINIPHDAAVGEYNFKTKVMSNGAPVAEKLFDKPIIILFNPWNEYDDVYLPYDLEKHEYVIEKLGRIWQGNQTNLKSIPWDYAQFEDATITTILQLLNGLSSSDRSSPILVSRHLTNKLAYDDIEQSGVLKGRWQRSRHALENEEEYQQYLNTRYADGTKPWIWQSSKEIFDNFLISGGLAVKYGQCWVFGGILTSALRSLGIPARTITNYESGHDFSNPLNKAIDIYYSWGQSFLKDKERSDDIWNFHVWTEAWMKRPDRPGFDGWQAVDATPLGLMELGPAPVKAVFFNTEPGGNYDIDFVYGEVRAVKNIWWDFGVGDILKESDPLAIGQYVSTKAIGTDERNDITYTYDGQQPLSSFFADALNDNISIETYISGEIEIGTNIVGLAMIENISENTLTIKANITCSAIDYNGIILTQLGSDENTYSIDPGSSRTVTLMVQESKYRPYSKVTRFFEITIAVHIVGTEEVFFEEQRAQLIVPGVDVALNPSSTINQKENTNCNVYWVNPFSYSLNNATLKIYTSDALSIERNYQTQFDIGTIGPGQHVFITKEILGVKEGRGIVSAVLNTDDQYGVNGHAYIDVKSIGDFDNDGDVDGSDLSILLFEPNIIDISVFANHYGK